MAFYILPNDKTTLQLRKSLGEVLLKNGMLPSVGGFMISLFHVMFWDIMSKFGRHVNSAPLDPCNYIRGSNISQHKTCAHCLNTDYPTGLQLYKGPAFAIKIERKQKKTCVLFAFVLLCDFCTI